MIAINQVLYNRYLATQLATIAYGRGLIKEAAKLLKASDHDLIKIIVANAYDINQQNFYNKSSQIALQKMVQQINELRDPIWNEMLSYVRTQYKEFGEHALLNTGKTIESSVPVRLGIKIPDANVVTKVIDSTPCDGKTLKDWFEKCKEVDAQRIISVTKSGLIQGQTLQQIVNQVSAKSNSSVIQSRANKDIETSILTTLSGIQNGVRQQVYKENADVISKEVLIATLDSRVTLLCASLDHKEYDIGEGPMPPLHPRCRTIRVPKVDPEILYKRGFDNRLEKELVQEFAEQNDLGNVKKRENLPRGFKGKFDDFYKQKASEMVGQIDAKITANEWLKQRSNSFQDYMLGKTKAELFRQGKIDLKDMINDYGHTLTLDDLRARGIEF